MDTTNLQPGNGVGEAAGSGSPPPAPPDASPSPWTPLHEHLFRAVWLAGLGSNIGSMMQQSGAAWLMTDLSPSPLLVSLMQAAGSLPVFLLALPAGALADVLDRRRLILIAQCWMLVVATLLAVLAYLGLVVPGTLLALVFLTAVGSTLAEPAMQATVGDILPPPEIPKGIVLGNTSINLARAVGPLAAGLLISQIGSWSAFAVNALSFLGLLVVFWRWKPAPRERSLPAERFVGAVLAGLRYLRYSPPLRTVLARGGLFALFANGLWSLIPIVARRELGLGAVGYGGLMACIGLGALLGAMFLPHLRRRMHTDLLVSVMTLVFAAATLALGHVRVVPLLCAILVAGGLAWLGVFSSLAVAAGASVPNWVKGRGLAVYTLVFQGSMTAGSFLWGSFASLAGISTALTVAAAGLALGTLSALVWRLERGEGLNLAPSGTRPAPVLAGEPEPERGPVMVTVEYRIDPQQAPGFAAVMREVGRQRYRDGAFFWGLFEDVADPGRYVEFFSIESWVEHLRQHERVTVSDRDVEEGAKAFHLGSEPPRVSHFVAEPVGRPAGPEVIHRGQGEHPHDFRV